MASSSRRAEKFYKHEGWASGIPLAAWGFLGSYLIEDGSTRDAVWAGLFAVSSLRALCWRRVSWARYVGLEGTLEEGYPPIGPVDWEPPVLTMPERLSLWLVPVGYLVVSSVGMGAALAHAFAGGIAAAVVTGILYRRVQNVELLFRVSDY